MLLADWSAPLGLLEGIEAVGCILEPAGHTARHVSSHQSGDFESLFEPAGWTVGAWLQTAILQQAGCARSHWELLGWAWRAAGDLGTPTLLDLNLQSQKREFHIVIVLQDSKMEYLAVVVANKNQISALSPSIGSNWPGILLYFFPQRYCHFFCSIKEAGPDFKSTERGAW